MPFGYPGARTHPMRGPGTEKDLSLCLIQLALERVVRGARRAVGFDQTTVERGRAAVAEVVVAVQALDVLVVLLDEVEHVLRAARLAAAVTREAVAEAGQAA